MTVIGKGVFYKCGALQHVDIPDSVTEIGEEAFGQCESLQSIAIPESVKKIGSIAFSFCSSLQSVDIPESVTEIGKDAFSQCDSLQTVNLLGEKTEIGYRAFAGCKSLVEINVCKDNAFYCSENGVLYDKAKSKILLYPAGKKESAFSLPESVTAIGDVSFAFCSSLQSVEIPASVSAIGKKVFFHNDSLQTIRCRVQNPDNVDILDTAFSEEIYAVCALLVPSCSLEVYRSHPVFGQFKNIAADLNA